MPIPTLEIDAPPQVPIRTPVSGPIVVASDGSEDTDAAMAMAWAIGGRTCGNVQVLSCASPFDATGELQAVKPSPDERWRLRRDRLLLAIRDQMKRTLPTGCSWPVTVVAGYGGEDIAAFARTVHAGLIITGRGRHRLFDRMIHPPEEVVRVLQLADVPVLAVAREATTLPRRIVIATDFSAYSTYAGRVALQFAARDAVVYLAHVRPRPLVPGPQNSEWEHAYQAALPAMFSAARDGLMPAEGQVIETVELAGEPGPVLREFASASRADLIVSATHARGFFDRMVLGSVAIDLLRRAPCSFLCVPGAALDRHVAASGDDVGARTAIPTAELPAALDQFSARNAGRACNVELVRPDEAPQHIVKDRPFVRAAFERARGALTIVVGTLVGPTAEHTHILSSIRAVDRLVDTCDRDRGLLVDDGDAGLLRLVFSS